MNKVIKKISSYFPKHKRSDLEKKYEILEKLGTYVDARGRGATCARRTAQGGGGKGREEPHAASPRAHAMAGAFGRDGGGSGNFSVVKKCRDRETSKFYALKIIDKKLVEGKEEMIETECEILRRVHHPNIISMIEAFDTEDKLYLVMDL